MIIGVLVRVGVRVGVRVSVPVLVIVAEGLGVGERVVDGVRVGGKVAVAGLVGVEVDPIWTCSVARKSPGLTGVISSGEQNCPVMVQASANSSGESGSGAEGGLTAEVPSGPPSSGPLRRRVRKADPRFGGKAASRSGSGSAPSREQETPFQ